MAPITDPVEVVNPTIPKVITNKDNMGGILDTCDSSISEGQIDFSYYKQICVYGFRILILLEMNEKVEYACKNVGIFKMGSNEDKAYWLYYYLKTQQAKEYIISHLRGSTQQYLPLESLRTFPILQTDVNSSRKIISVLKMIDSKIENNKKINGNLLK